MLQKISRIYMYQYYKNPKLYLFLALIFFVGVVSGYFAVGGLYDNHREELKNYVQGFMKIFSLESIDNMALFKVSLFREMRTAIILWLLGVSIVGIPLIIVIVLVRGFITGFSIGIIFTVLGTQGISIVLPFVLLKELLIIPILLTLAGNGINFSMEILKNCTGKRFSFDNVKLGFVRFGMFTIIQMMILFIPTMFEAIFMPVFIKS